MSAVSSYSLVTPASGDSVIGLQNGLVKRFPASLFLGAYTWANLPAAASYANALAFATDLGTNGALVTSNGSRWRPVNGQANLFNLTTAISGIANSETNAAQTRLPINAWQAGDTIRVWITMAKNGSTDTGNLTFRVGTAGTTGDTAMTGLTGVAILAAASLSGGFIYDVKLVSATSALRVGAGAAAVASYNAGISVAAAAATTITDASANSLYFSVNALSSGASNTVTVQGCTIALITP